MPRPSEDGNIVADSAAGTDISTGGFIPASIRPGKVVVISGSELTTAQLIDPEGQTPNAIFLHNVTDYLNGNTGLIQMRGKGLSYNPLRDTSPGVRAAIKAVNIGGLPLLAILMGLVVWRYRTLKRRKIREQFEGAGKDE